MREPTPLQPLVHLDDGPRHESWGAKSGSLRIEWTQDGSVLVTLDGHGDGRFAQVIARRCESLLVGESEHISLFFDAWTMTSYDSALRVDLTAWVKKRRTQISRLHVAFQSKLVAMGVAVANVALGDMIRAHSARDSFDRLLRDAGFELRRS